jgi:putative membrane protein
MLRGTSRWIIAIFVAILGALFPVAGIVFAEQGQPEADAAPGQAEPIEREFMTVIRFANLWEIPMGQLAAKRGSTQVVKDVGTAIAADHTQLDVAIKKLAGQFGVGLPDKATSSQQSWMNEISGKTGAEFDRTFVDRLRAAHGTVFGLVSEVRAGTRNEAIRAFAETANVIVMKHMRLLESTGLVDGEHGLFAQAAARTSAYPENKLSKNAIVLAIVLGFVMVAGTLLVVRTGTRNGTSDG